MGYYINTLSNGTPLPSRGKAEFLVKHANAKVVQENPFSTYEGGFQPDLVCVVSNPAFDAAGFAFSEREMRNFNDPRDLRPRVWLIVPDAAELSRYGPACREAHKDCVDGSCTCRGSYDQYDCAYAGCATCMGAYADV